MVTSSRLKLLKTPVKISFAQLLDLLKQVSPAFIDLSKLKYDFACKKIIYDNLPFKSKYYAGKFKTEFPDFDFTNNTWYDVVYQVAMDNTDFILEKETDHDPLSPMVMQWLDNNEKQEVYVSDIVTTVFNGKFADLRDKQLQMRIANILRANGWERKKTKYSYKWWLPSKKSDLPEKLT